MRRVSNISILTFIVLILFLSCNPIDEIKIDDCGTGIIYFKGEAFDNNYCWDLPRTGGDPWVMGFGSGTTNDSETLRLIETGINYDDSCCWLKTSWVTERITVKFVDLAPYDVYNFEDRERLIHMFSLGEKKLAFDSIQIGEFEIEFIRNLNDSLHYFSSKWGPQPGSYIKVIDNEEIINCINNFDKTTGDCKPYSQFLTFEFNCSLYDLNKEFTTQITGEMRVHIYIGSQ
jgi:hypothetical protein